MGQNIFIGIIKFIIFDLILDILYFPVWWYSKGLKKFGLLILRQIKRKSENLALGILLKNLFKPMYGDYTRSGKIISFFARVILLGFRLLIMIIWLVLILALFFSWIVLPILAVYQIIEL